MTLVLGIDGGASKTHALLMTTRGEVMGFGSGAGGNHQSHGLERAVAEIKKAVNGALADSSEIADLACYCLAGADLESDFVMLQPAMQGLGAAKETRIKNDTMAAMRSGLSRPWGVVVICGSGFNGAARTPVGSEVILPGLGAMSGDWGGGSDLAQEMISLIMRAWDTRGKKTALTGAVLEALNLPSTEALLDKLYHQKISHQRLRKLVPILFETAEKGDAVSRDLIIRLGIEIGVTARSLIRRGGMEELNPEVVLGGSVYKGKGRLLIDTIKSDIHAHYPGVHVKRPRYEPVVGAALLAIEELGILVDDEVMNNLEATLPARLKIYVPDYAK